MPMPIVILLTVSLLFTLPAKAEMYSWTDEYGVKHFSNTPVKIKADAAVTHEYRMSDEKYQQLEQDKKIEAEKQAQADKQAAIEEQKEREAQEKAKKDAEQKRRYEELQAELEATRREVKQLREDTRRSSVVYFNAQRIQRPVLYRDYMKNRQMLEQAEQRLFETDNAYQKSSLNRGGQLIRLQNHPVRQSQKNSTGQ